MVKQMAKFTPVLIDGDEHKAGSAKYGVSGFPTVVFCDADGNAVNRVVGAVPVSHFRAKITAAAKQLGL